MLQIQPQNGILKSNIVWRFLTRSWRWCCKVALVQSSVSSYFEPLIRLIVPGYRAGLMRAQLISVRQQADYLQLQLKPTKAFQGFMPGQHVQLSVELNGALVSRTFSISSSLQQFLAQGTLQLTLKIQPHAGLTRALAERAGSAVDCYLSQAQGDFVFRPQQAAIMLAAGSGITPVHAMLSSLSRLTQPVVLFYSFRGADSLLFADSWQQLKTKFPLLQIEFCDTSLNPRIDAAQVETTLEQLRARGLDTAVYLCGPQAFNQQWLQWAATLGVASVYQESFGVAFRDSGQAGDGHHHRNQHETIEVTAFQRGQRYALQSSGNLLQSLELAGLSPRYGCRRGICMQCLCEKKSGQVQNLLTGDISSNGVEPVQLCISAAITPVQLQLDSLGGSPR